MTKRDIIKTGRDGGYILSPAHAVEGDVPLETMLAFVDEALSQSGAGVRGQAPGAGGLALGAGMQT